MLDTLRAFDVVAYELAVIARQPEIPDSPAETFRSAPSACSAARLTVFARGIFDKAVLAGGPHGYKVD
jgi:hypothetical protein